MVATVMSAPVSACCSMMLPEIHPVQLVAAQDEQVIEIVVEKVHEILAHGVGGAFIPGRVGERLLRGEDFHEAAGKLVEFIGAAKCGRAARWN